jgi:hypothetical protein
MEDIPKNLEKEIARLERATSLKRRQHWMLLLVNDHGRVLSFRRFKGLVTLSVLLVVVSLSAAAAFYFLYEEERLNNRQLQNAAAVSRKHASTLRAHNEKLTAKLVIAESRIKDILAEVEKEKIEIKTRPADPAPSAEIVSTDLPAVEAPPAAGVDAQEENADEITEALPQTTSPYVDIETFRLLRKEESSGLTVQFKIRKISPDAGPVAGYTFVLLKDREDDPEKWLIFPEVDMVAGKPAAIKKGQHFSIFRFKTISMSKNEEIPQTFTTASVMVYDTSGQPVLEKTFPIDGLPQTD